MWKVENEIDPRILMVVSILVHIYTIISDSSSRHFKFHVKQVLLLFFLNILLWSTFKSGCVAK